MIDTAKLLHAEGPSPQRGDSPQQVARHAEEIFARTLLKEIRNAMPDKGLLGGGQAGGMWSDLLDEELAKRIADTGGLGVADQVLRMLGETPAPRPIAPLALPAMHRKPAAAPSPVAPHAHDHDCDDHRVTEGRLTSRFGTRADPLHKNQRFHAGVDIGAPTGTPIRALRPGTVTFAGDAGGYGNLVVIDHGGGLETRYAHASALHVQKGQQVAAGEEIAAVGSTGRSTGPHLHFEVRKHGKPIDPLPYLKTHSTKESAQGVHQVER